MAKVNYYYDEVLGYVDYGTVINQYLVTWFANNFLLNDVSRIVYADNASAFRRRSDTSTTTSSSVVSTNTGNLNLPFLNFTQKDGMGEDPNNWYHWRLDKVGVYVPELETSVKMAPIQIPYECTFWCSSTSEMRYVANILYFLRANHTEVSIPIQYQYTNAEGVATTVDIPLYAKFNFEMQVDPQYEQNEWLEQNVKHSISMDFTITSWGMKLGANSSAFSITEETILRFKNNLDESATAAWDKIVSTMIT